MRVYITLLVAVAALFASSDAAVGSTTKLTSMATSESIADFQTQNNNGLRNLRKRKTDETDELDEDRAFDVKNLSATFKGWLSGSDKKLLGLLKSGATTDDLIAKNIKPGAIDRVVQQAKTKLSAEDFNKFKALASEYDEIWYRTKNLDPWA